MFNSPERIKNKIEFKSALIVGGAEMARLAGQVWRLEAISTGTPFDAIHPAVNFILDYTGDFSLGYLFTWGMKDLIPKISQKAKLNIATGLVLTGGVLLESLNLPGSHPEDIPALVVGIGAYRALHWRLNRLFQTKNRP